MSRPKNAALSNKPCPEKLDGHKDLFVGYRFGSYAENEVAREKEWTPDRVLARGLKMLNFLERRWNIPLGDDQKKKKILGLDFL